MWFPAWVRCLQMYQLALPGKWSSGPQTWPLGLILGAGSLLGQVRGVPVGQAEL